MIAERSDEIKLAALMAGEPLHFAPEADEQDRRVRAEWIVEVVRIGLPLDLEGAVIIGALDLDGRFVPGPWSMKRCRVGELNLADVRFAKSAEFTGSEFEAGLLLARTRFEADAVFDTSVVKGTLHVHDAVFAVASSWRGMHCTGDARFATTTFGADVDCGDAIVDGALVFEMTAVAGALRLSGLSSGSDFRINGGTIAGALHVGDARFARDVRIHGVDVAGALVANGARIAGSVHIDESRF
jgi:hypothetical protein